MHARATGRRPSCDGGPEDPWIRVLHDGGNATPEQGWKLHLSATVASAEEILRRALPVLLAEEAVFKVAGSLATLTALNQGDSGLAQVGKFVTVYPRDDDQAVRLAARLDEVTRGLPGPAIPSDRALRPGSRVFYRYGSYGQRALQLPTGELVPAMKAPDGQLVPDRRPTAYASPAWAVDPFVAAGVAPELPRATATRVIAGRYVPAATLHRSPRSTVLLALDLKAYRRCVLKRVERWDAARLRHEADVLRRLGPDPGFPALHDILEDDEHLHLVLEDLAGETLTTHVQRDAARGIFAPPERLVALGRALAALLGKLHAAGLAHGDLKSSNVLLGSDPAEIRLIDFEMAHGPSLPALLSHGRGTRGYRSPAQIAGALPSPADDIHALGALLYFVATGAEPAEGPRDAPLHGRPPEVLNPALPPALCAVITRCLAPDPRARFATAADVSAALADALLPPSLRARAAARPAFPTSILCPAPTEVLAFLRHPPDAHPSDAEEVFPHPVYPEVLPPPASDAPPASYIAPLPSLPSARPVRAEALDLAWQLADTLVHAAAPAPAPAPAPQDGLFWPDLHPAAHGLPSRDIGHGTAGIVLALAALTTAFGVTAHRATLARAAMGLLHAPRPEGPPAAGLYLGEAGVGTALLAAGRALDDPSLCAAAEARGRFIATLPFVSPDLYNGAAGRLRFHLWLWTATGREEHLDAALRAGAHLLTVAERDDEGYARWTSLEASGRQSCTPQLGYAHGAAGIADCLLDLAEASGETHFLEAARGAARWLTAQAVPALADGSGRAWPVVENGPPHDAHWCHGATGIGRFFLHAAACNLLPSAGDMAARAARTVARGARWIGPSQCHGLAGNVEFLVDMFQETADATYLADAAVLFRLLQAFADEHEGRRLWQADRPGVRVPAFQVGYAGVAACLLRLGDPAAAPHLLSGRAFGGPARMTRRRAWVA
ncbi:lanthionine synthetase LanC family protein [Chondromyces apiculatus]|uniref:class III lanthionine synthetase LanKC N-terminal domain-containing protein n=1 Tax=Chondromyces apiculatus TaxID=51 RepID=UPI0005C59F44|nr:lanthionine synthetase LanC family protein [Chondromyces apiculatus]